MSPLLSDAAMFSEMLLLVRDLGTLSLPLMIKRVYTAMELDGSLKAL